MTLKRIEADTADRMNCLVIGPAGIGKTSLLRTIPASEKVCVISAESGLLCVRDLVRNGTVEGWEVGSFADMTEAYMLLAQNAEVKGRYRWVFIDSLTEISARCVESMKAKYPQRSDSFAMWGEYNDLMTGLIKGFRDLRDYNVVFTSLEQVEKDDLNRRYVAPQVSGASLKDRLVSFFDEVFYYTFVKGADGADVRALLTQPYDRYPAKDRSGKLTLAETPDLGAIKKKIFEGGN
jgi:hypothetical protein